jgi:hypothetical protein
VLGDEELNPRRRDASIALDPADGVPAHADELAELFRGQPTVDPLRSDLAGCEAISRHAK